jgi:hypothetical protein
VHKLLAAACTFLQLAAVDGSCPPPSPGSCTACTAWPALKAWAGGWQSLQPRILSSSCLTAQCSLVPLQALLYQLPTFEFPRHMFGGAKTRRHRRHPLDVGGPAAAQAEERTCVGCTPCNKRLVGGSGVSSSCLKNGHCARRDVGPSWTVALKQRLPSQPLERGVVPAVPAERADCHAGIYRCRSCS